MNENENSTAQKSGTSEEKKKKIIFIARLAFFIIFGAIVPVCFVAWRYGLFTSGEVKFTTAGWGIIASVVLFVILRYVMGQVSVVLPWSLFSQVITGFMKVILPLLCLYFILNSIEDSLELLTQSVLAIILCESVAICVNPFPQWRRDHGIEEKNKDFSEFAKTFVKTWKEDK